jgi:hypothetical protein
MVMPILSGLPSNPVMATINSWLKDSQVPYIGLTEENAIQLATDKWRCVN